MKRMRNKWLRMIDEVIDKIVYNKWVWIVIVTMFLLSFLIGMIVTVNSQNWMETGSGLPIR